MGVALPVGLHKLKSTNGSFCGCSVILSYTGCISLGNKQKLPYQWKLIVLLEMNTIFLSSRWIHFTLCLELLDYPYLGKNKLRLLILSSVCQKMSFKE